MTQKSRYTAAKKTFPDGSTKVILRDNHDLPGRDVVFGLEFSTEEKHLVEAAFEIVGAIAKGLNDNG